MPSDIDVATNTTLGFATSTGFTPKITNIKIAGIGREAIECSNHASSGWREFKPGDLKDPGEIEFDFYVNPDEQPPHAAVPEVITVSFPLQTGQVTRASVAGSGFVTKWDEESPLEEMITGKGRIKYTGALTFTDAA